MNNNNTINIQFITTIPQNFVEGGKTEKKYGGKNMQKLLDEYKVHLAVKHRKNNSTKTYYNAAKQFLTHTQGQINQNTINQYLIHLNQNYKQNTISMYIMGLDLLLKYLHLEYLHVPIPQGEEIQRDTITTSEIKQILKHAEQTNIQTYVMTRFVTDFDCRPHEITKAEWNWIRGNKIYFNDCKTGNNYGFITQELKTHLQKLKKWQHYKSKKYIFINQHGRYRGKKFSDNGWNIRETIKKLTTKTIGRPLTTQDLRASIITEEYNHYINPKTIQRKARHRSQKTTLKYNHIDDRQLEHYITQGTIFNINNSFISKPISVDKRSYINTLPQEQQYPPWDEKDNNNDSFSFSISFYKSPPLLPSIGCYPGDKNDKKKLATENGNTHPPPTNIFYGNCRDKQKGIFLTKNCFCQNSFYGNCRDKQKGIILTESFCHFCHSTSHPIPPTPHLKENTTIIVYPYNYNNMDLVDDEKNDLYLPWIRFNFFPLDNSSPISPTTLNVFTNVHFLASWGTICSSSTTSSFLFTVFYKEGQHRCQQTQGGFVA